MISNSAAIVDRETASQHIEGVDFGVDLWVVARSPTAVLVWVKGHSWSVNGFQRYSAGHLVGLPERGPRAVGHLEYKYLWEGEGKRFGWRAIEECGAKVNDLFNLEIHKMVRDAVRKRATLVIQGGGGQLRPPGLYGHAYAEWVARGGGFLVLPEGMTEYDACRHKLGWKPREASQ
jgi:hypothetical protein